MKTKIIIVIIAGGMFFSGIVAPVKAEDGAENPEYKTQKFLEQEAKIIEPGVLPNSFWYWADIFSEQIRFVFTVGKESKGDYLIDLAEERLAEMKALSEQGITKYAEELISRHEDEVKKAEEFYKAAKVKGWEQIQQSQEDLEKQILRQEAELKKQAKVAPQKYEQGKQSAISRIGKWFGQVLSHLSWKKTEIQGQEAEMWE